jgi:hypothetical protein
MTLKQEMQVWGLSTFGESLPIEGPACVQRELSANDGERRGGEEAVAAHVTHHNPKDRPECQRYEELISTPLAVITTLPKDELIKRYDELLTLKHPPCQVQRLYSVGPDDYRDELNRRTAHRQTVWLIGLTWLIVVLTGALIVLDILPRILGNQH